MVDRQDWISWDNSMKAHIDQIEVKWKNDVVLLAEKQAEVARTQSDINNQIVDNLKELVNEHKRTRNMIALCYMLILVDAILCIAAYDALGGI